MRTTAATGRPTVFIHVGAPKTGTTFLQEVLWANREKLAEESVTLPGSPDAHFHATLDVREVPLDRHPPAAAGAWSRLVDEILRSRGTVIVSHELFAGASREQARRAVESLHPADVHIVYTARDLARQIPAEWQEHVKHRSRLRMGEFVDQVIQDGPQARWFWRVQDAAGVLERWGEGLPRDRVHVITVPPAGAEPGLLWRRFASLIGVDPGEYDTLAARPNVSLGAAEVELLRRTNTALGDRLSEPGSYPRFAKELLAHEVLTERQGKAKFGLRPDRARWLEEQSRQTIEEIRKLDCDVVGDLDELRPSERSLAGVHPDDIEDVAVLDVAADTVADLLVRLRDQTIRAEAATRRARELDRGLAGTDYKPWIKRKLVALSERHRLIMRARVVYWRAVNAVRRIRAKVESGDGPGDGGGAARAH